MKNCGLSFETPLLFSSFSPLFWKRRPSLHSRCRPLFPPRTSVRANGHAPAHRALSEFEFLAFTLHLHPQFIDTVCVVYEGKTLFLPSPVKEKGMKPSHTSRCFIGSYGRMVKR